jgi:hypothetical protein
MQRAITIPGGAKNPLEALSMGICEQLIAALDNGATPFAYSVRRPPTLLWYDNGGGSMMNSFGVDLCDVIDMLGDPPYKACCTIVMRADGLLTIRQIIDHVPVDLVDPSSIDLIITRAVALCHQTRALREAEKRCDHHSSLR